MHIEFEIITSMCVQSSVLIGEVFQIEVSDGHAHGKLSKSKLVSS